MPNTVLVVDDDEDIVSLMRDFLEAEGFAVATASDGSGAFAALEKDPVDVVLLDVMMPGQSGFDVLRRILCTKRPSRVECGPFWVGSGGLIVLVGRCGRLFH